LKFLHTDAVLADVAARFATRAQRWSFLVTTLPLASTSFVHDSHSTLHIRLGPACIGAQPGSSRRVPSLNILGKRTNPKKRHFRAEKWCCNNI